MIRSSLCDYSVAYILVKGTIIVPNTETQGANCAPFTSCITEINNTRVDYAEDLDIVTPMYNLIEYSNVYSKTSGSLWQYYRDEPALDDNDKVTDFPEIMVPLKYLNNLENT